MTYRLHIFTKSGTHDYEADLPEDLPMIVESFLRYQISVGDPADYKPAVIKDVEAVMRLYIIEPNGDCWDVKGLEQLTNVEALDLAMDSPDRLVLSSRLVPAEEVNPVMMVEAAMEHIKMAHDLLTEAVKDHPVGPSFTAGMLNALKTSITPTDDPNFGTLHLLIKILQGERIVPAGQIDSDNPPVKH